MKNQLNRSTILTMKLDEIAFFDPLDKDSIIDAMTLTLRKKALILYINNLIKEKIPFVSYFIDFDCFKKVNDTLGHQVGDKTLRDCAEILAKSAPEDSVIGRYGGDEFVIIVKNVQDYDTTWNIARDLCESMRNHPFEYLRDSFPSGKVTVTIGSSRYPLDASNYDDLIFCADKALYKGKLKGRNCFIIYDKSKKYEIEVEKKVDLPLNDLMQNILILFRSGKDDFEILKESTNLITKRYNDAFVVYLTKDESKIVFENENNTDAKYVVFPYKFIHKDKNKKPCAVWHYFDLEEDDPIKDLMKQAKVMSFFSIRIMKDDIDEYLLIESRRDRFFTDEELLAYQMLCTMYSLKTK